MTELTIYTNSEEVNDIYTGNLRWIPRGHRVHAKVGDIINFRLVKNEKEIYHQINRKKYEITRIDTQRTAPILKYWQVISFKEITNDSAY